MLQHLLNQRAQILNETEASEDVYGDAAKIFVDDSLKLWPCRLEGWKGKEFEIDRDTRVTFYRLMVNPDAPLSATSRVVIDDITYEVYGDVLTFLRRQVADHNEAIVRRISA